MLPANENHDNFVIGPDGFAESCADILSDQLAECGLNDPNFGDPANWPWHCDLGRFELGPGADFDDLPGEAEDENPF